VVLALVVLVPLLQLVSLPESLWLWPAARPSLQRDLATAGVTGAHWRWTLAPAATERAALALLPPVALFLAALAMNREALRGVMWVTVLLGLFSLILAVAQVGLPQDSLVNLYPQYVPNMGGIFANRNHQAISLVVALVLSLALALNERRRIRNFRGSRAKLWALTTLVLVLGVTLPLVGSRAGLLLGIFATVITLFVCRAVSFRGLRGHWSTQLTLAGIAAVFVAGVYGAMSWMQLDEIDAVYGTRGLLTKQTMAMAAANAPFGTGIGSFVPAFEQATDPAALQSVYVNHAHNEYAQLWLESGALGLVCVAAAMLVLLSAGRRLMALPSRSGLRTLGMAALICVAALLVHSAVDYPLRTPALMSEFGLLAGIVLSCAAQTRRTSSGTGSSARVEELQPVGVADLAENGARDNDVESD
jgi:O-antigen ligase